MASSPFTLHISATSSLLKLLFHPIIVATTYREDYEAIGDPSKRRSEILVLALSTTCVLAWISLSWSWRLVTFSDYHHLGGPTEDLVTFLSGVLIEEAQIGIHGLKLTIPDWRMGIHEVKWSLTESWWLFGPPTWTRGCGNNLTPWEKNLLASLPLFWFLYYFLPCSFVWKLFWVHLGLHCRLLSIVSILALKDL